MLAVWMSAERFESIVGQELDLLPDGVARYLENVEVLVEDWPSLQQVESLGLGPDETLFGLYEGVPLTARSTSYSLVLPDRITVFRGPILGAHHSMASVRAQVRQTIIHEIAHHFGIDDERLIALGAY